MAFGESTISNAGGAVSDIFAGLGHAAKAEGDRLESGAYLKAATLADQNADFTRVSTAIKETQLDRNLSKTIGQQQADVASSGFQASGSALDIMRDSASQGALTKQVLGQQGLITEAGYKEQADSYRTMSEVSLKAADAEGYAEIGSYVSSATKAISSVASFFV